MAQTPLTGASSYATPADFRLAYDVRVLGQFADDTNTPLSAGAIDADAAIAAALQQASGRVESSAMIGARYRPEDLSALSGNARAWLVRLVVDVGYEYLRRRRGHPEQPTAAYFEALKDLDRLQAGDAVFGTAEAASASVPGNRFVTQREFDQWPRPSRLRRAFGERLRDSLP